MRSLLVLSAFLTAPAVGAGEIRVGIIGLDTSHVTAFTKILNNPKAEGDLAGFKVVAAFPGGSKDIKASYGRLDLFTKALKEQYGVEIVGSIDELLTKVDVVLLESVDGRPHLEQVLPVLRAGKKVFIDKPVAGSLADALLIYEAAAAYKVPVFSSSSLRFGGVVKTKNDPKLGQVLGCVVHSPCEIEEHHPDLFWYGVHGVEMLYTLMGTGCKSVTRTHTKGADVVTGVWADGRIATYHGLRSGKPGYGGIAYGSKGNVPVGGSGGYEPLLVEIAKFFRTGTPPVSAGETIEMFAFMEAADESKRQGGAPVTIESVLAKARAENVKRGLKFKQTGGGR